MEAASGLIKTSVDLFKLLDASYQKNKELPKAVNFIQSELRSIEEAIITSSGDVDQHGISSSWIADLKEIRQKIEDAVDFYNYKVICEDDDPTFVYELYHATKTTLGLGARSELIEDIEGIKNLLADAKKRKGYHENPPQPGQAIGNGAYQHANVADPKGLDTAKEDLLQFLRPTDGGSATKLRVIAISGLGGSGKTVLAKATCDLVRNEFDCYSWVTASKNNVNKILKDILDNVRMVKLPPSQGISNHVAAGSLSEDNISDHLRKFLEDKRYIVRIDDLQLETGVWNNILCAFPDNRKGSRVIITTTNNKLARRCSNNCRVYRMQPLDIGSARSLLERELPAEHRCPTNLVDPSLLMILESCEYHPLAVVNMAGYIRDRDEAWDWEHDKCQQACNCIMPQLVDGTGAFVGMSRVLNRIYSSLNYNTMTCLLSLSTYPKNHIIKRKSLIRRWLAERLITCKDQRSDDDILEDCITDLVDNNLIMPIKISISGVVKTFRVHQMVLQFIKAKANSDNFVTWIHVHEGYKKGQAHNICRLYVHNSSPGHSSRIGRKDDLARVRSLTYSGQANKTLMNFKDFQLLRVLDLESCINLKDDNLDTVCKSAMLKYLSIRGNKGVTKLPPTTVKLQQLETLDVRDTAVEMLGAEVIQLPMLTHLFGVFQITCKNSDLSKLETFFTKNISNLQTLAGFCIDESPGLVKLLPLMRKLMKVKISCRRTDPSNEVADDLLLHLKKCFQRDLSPPNLCLVSVSMDFGDGCDLDFLHKLEVSPTFLRSLKLRGKFSEMSRGLPKFILSSGLKELCLSGTHLGCSVLSELHGLPNLQFLKLTEDRLRTEVEEVTCGNGWFENLKRLCLDVTTLPRIVIQENAMKSLKSLQLFCLTLVSIFGVEHLPHLEELVLPSNVSGPEADDLSQQVSRHPMKPKFDRPRPSAAAASSKSGRTFGRS